MTTLKQTGPLPHTDEIAEQPLRKWRMRCPECGGMVTYRNEQGATMLDYHPNPRKPKESCNGSDLNMSEVEE